MPNRTYAATNSYRYGFNGKENDSEVKGEGNSLDFGARIYDPRIGRWLSVDPLQQKYPSFSPYNFALNNPNFYYDIDGKDVGVTITRNPQGGGSITFYSTTYVTGVDAAERVKLYNEAFKKFVDANPGMKSSDGKWDVKVKMEFKVATDDDVKRITNSKQEMAAENMMNIKTGTSRAKSGMPIPGSADKSIIRDIDPAGNNGKGLLIGTSAASGRFAQMYSKDDGKTAVHEELHNWGVGDYYADVTYKYSRMDNKTGKVDLTGTTNASSTSFVGFEGTIMAADGICIPQVTVDDMVNTALRTSDVKKSDNFVMARKVDSNRPNGSKRADQVLQKKVEKTKTKTTTYKNPTFKSAGN